MKFGLSDQHYDWVHQHLFSELKSKGCLVWVFGSRATGKSKTFSDLDVLYKKPAKNLPVGFLSQLIERLETSDLPIKVDLVEIDDLAESYRPSVLHDRIAV